MLAGLCMFSTSALYMLAIKLTTAANAIVLQYIAPILVLLYTMVIQRRRPEKIEIVLTFVVFTGCVLTFWDELNPGSILGNLLALLSGIALAAQIIVNRNEKTIQQDGLLIGCGLSFFVFLPFLLTDTQLAFTPTTVALGLFLGFIQYGAANLFFAKGIQRTDSLRASLLFTIEPILAPIWVYLFLNESPSFLAICGSVCVIAAVTIYNVYPLLSHKKSPATM
jgi:Permeases of the drug/metabolite transporter (DMT) superfamily